MKLGVIGIGNMGSAIIRGCIAAGMPASDIAVVGHNAEKAAAFAKETGVETASDIAGLTEKCDAVMIAVKPKDVRTVMAEIAKTFSTEKIMISIAAGKTIANLKEDFAAAEFRFTYCLDDMKIIRVMPNTPSMVGEGMSALCRTNVVGDEEFAEVMKIFTSIGRASEVSESLMPAVTGLSGSGPAYVYMFIEALADGAVLEGMPRAQAYEFAAQTVLGAAKMVLETGQHPAALKDAVCSPAGTTIEGVAALEAGGFRSTVIEAVAASSEKSLNM